MMFESARPRRSDEERVLPLINVVFLLLIFFMLAGRLVANDPLDVTPPQSASEGPAELREQVVYVGGDGRLAFDGSVLDKAALKAAVTARLADATDRRVRLKADGGAEAVQVVAVLELLREAGVEILTLLTAPENADTP